MGPAGDHDRWPGAVNAHTHVYSGLSSLGMPRPAEQPRSFLEILERIWWRLDRALDEKSLFAAARLYLGEALLSGTTVIVDHHESPSFIDGSLDVIADAAQEVGIRLATGYGATERNGGRGEARAGLAECRRFARENRRPLVRALVGLHASFTVSDETIREAGDLARELACPVHVHAGEDRLDVDDARRRGHRGPLERLRVLGGLPPGSILAHAVHLDARQVAAADAADCFLVQNPRSNEANRVGYPPALARSRRVALGTDGFPADMAAERAALLRIGLAHGEATDVLDARARWGRALGEALFGSLAGDAVTCGGRRVAVAGEVVVEDGRLVRADIDEIRARAREEARRLFARMA